MSDGINDLTRNTGRVLLDDPLPGHLQVVEQHGVPVRSELEGRPIAVDAANGERVRTYVRAPEDAQVVIDNLSETVRTLQSDLGQAHKRASQRDRLLRQLERIRQAEHIDTAHAIAAIALGQTDDSDTEEPQP